MIYVPTTKKWLVDEIYNRTNYTRKEIEDVYNKHLAKNPRQSKYYARRTAKRVLSWWFVKLVRNKS